MEYQDYYRILGVDKDAAPNQIQRAYRKLARTYHPDINKDPGAEVRFKQIGEAYDVLKDAQKRAKYDRYGAAWKSTQSTGRPPSGWEEFRFDFDSGGAGFSFDPGPSGSSSFFDMLFGGANRPGRTPRAHQAPSRGAHHESRLTIRLDETARGAKRQLTITDPRTGARQTIEVKIPQGVRAGQKIRLAGRGGAGSNGGPAGDLLLNIDIEPHPHFRTEGSDLHSYLEVSPWTAALGGAVEVRTLDGSTGVKLPPESSSGRRIRLRGKGLPTGKGTNGDLYAEVRIVLPPELSQHQKELFERLADDARAAGSENAE